MGHRLTVSGHDGQYLSRLHLEADVVQDSELLSLGSAETPEGTRLVHLIEQVADDEVGMLSPSGRSIHHGRGSCPDFGSKSSKMLIRHVIGSQIHLRRGLSVREMRVSGRIPTRLGSHCASICLAVFMLVAVVVVVMVVAVCGDEVALCDTVSH